MRPYADSFHSISLSYISVLLLKPLSIWKKFHRNDTTCHFFRWRHFALVSISLISQWPRALSRPCLALRVWQLSETRDVNSILSMIRILRFLKVKMASFLLIGFSPLRTTWNETRLKVKIRVSKNHAVDNRYFFWSPISDGPTDGGFLELISYSGSQWQKVNN